MAGKGYATANRAKILEYLVQNAYRTVTVADIETYLQEQGHPVNVTTIYRYLDKLESEDSINKYVAEKGGKTTYQYREQGHHCGEHLHLKCVKCGQVIHLECDFMKEIAAHIEQDHGFTLQCQNSMIYGTCEQCKKKKERG